MDADAADWPPLSDFSDWVARLDREADEALSGPRWSILTTSSNANHLLHLAAAIRHVLACLRDIDDARARCSPTGMAVLGRAHAEAFLVGMYLHYGTADALQHVAGAYAAASDRHASALTAYDQRVSAARRKARRRNKAIRKHNANLQAWNDAHPNLPSKALEPEVVVPDAAAVSSVTLVARLNEMALIAEHDDLFIADLAIRLSELAAEAEPDTTGPLSFDMLYQFVYRTLSSVGAHTNLRVLNLYIPDPGRAWLVRTNREADDVLGPTICRSALAMTAIMVDRPLTARGCEVQVARELLGEFQQRWATSTNTAEDQQADRQVEASPISPPA